MPVGIAAMLRRFQKMSSHKKPRRFLDPRAQSR
jgi:hypothetical protein